MSNLFKHNEIYKIKSIQVDPEKIDEPSSADGYQKRGMVYYARQQYDQAEKDLQRAVALDSTHIDAYYSLGMVLKAMHCESEATDAFQKVIDLISMSSETSGTSKTRKTMLRRLALGHINEMALGDWDLEKETWKHIA